MLAYCGLICDTCPIFLATKESDMDKKIEMRVDIARKCTEYFGRSHTHEDITDCDGCCSDSGRLFCKACRIRSCATAKSIENCAYCADYPCEELENIFAMDPDAKERLDQIKAKH
jgi:hypothetical protein